MNEKKKVDIQGSFTNGFVDQDSVKDFFTDLRDVLIKHNIKNLRSAHTEVDNNNVLIVKNSVFVCKDIDSSSVEKVPVDKETLLLNIDAALDSGDTEWFSQLTKQLIELEGEEE